MIKRAVTSIALAGLIAPMGASANNLSYTYGEGKLALYPSFGEFGSSQDLFGLDLRGAFEITPDIFAFGGFQYLTDDVDYTAIHIGGAYRFAIDERTDVWGGISLEYQDFEVQFRTFDPFTGRTITTTASDDDLSIGLRGGIRHRMSDEWEFAGTLRLVTGDFDYLGLTGTALYYMTDELALVGDVDIFDGNLGLAGGARFNF